MEWRDVCGYSWIGVYNWRGVQIFTCGTGVYVCKLGQVLTPSQKPPPLVPSTRLSHLVSALT